MNSTSLIGTIFTTMLLFAGSSASFGVSLSVFVLTFQSSFGWVFERQVNRNLTEFHPYVGLPDSPLHRVLRFLPTRLPPGQCRGALMEYLDALNEGSEWALHFYDASTKYPDGVLSTNGYYLGNYDQCLAAKTSSFSGKHCLVTVQYSKMDSSNPILPPSRFAYRRNAAHIALCIPSVCKAVDVKFALQDAVQLFPVIRDYHIKVSLPENYCNAEEPVDQSSDNTLWNPMILALAALVVSNIWSYLRTETYEDLQRTTTPEPWAISRYWSKLFTPCESDENIKVAHGLRFVGILIVVIGHRMEAVASSSLMNPDYQEDFLKNPLSIIVVNGQLYVEFFFTLSGFLLCWKIMKQQEKGKPLGSLALIYQRYVRLVPPYAVAVLLQALVVDKLASGPLWNLFAGKEAANCRKNWWANLLFINNYWDPSNFCMDQSWYVACDFQLLFLGVLVIQPVFNWKINRYLPLLLAICASFWIPFAVNYRNGLDAIVIPDSSTVGKTSTNATNVLQYITAYCRAGSYLVGIAAALILDYLQKSKIIPADETWRRGWWIVIVLSYGTKFLAVVFLSDTPVNPIFTAVYAAACRPAFSIGVAYLIIASVYGKAGYLSFLSSPVFLPLSRITYSMYLTHSLWIQLTTSWIRTPQYASDLYQATLISSDFLCCLLIGLVFYLLVECPCSDIIQRLTTSSRSRKTESEESTKSSQSKKTQFSESAKETELMVD